MTRDEGRHRAGSHKSLGKGQRGCLGSPGKGEGGDEREREREKERERGERTGRCDLAAPVPGSPGLRAPPQPPSAAAARRVPRTARCSGPSPRRRSLPRTQPDPHPPPGLDPAAAAPCGSTHPCPIPSRPGPTRAEPRRPPSPLRVPSSSSVRPSPPPVPPGARCRPVARPACSPLRPAPLSPRGSSCGSARPALPRA